MTRINCVKPETLSNAHLLAEYRELPRIFGLVSAAILRGEQPDNIKNPVAYTLGTGHCRFFYNKLGYLYKRQADICRELRKRGYQLSYDHYGLGKDIDVVYHEGWWGDWTPTIHDQHVSLARLKERDPVYYADHEI